MAIAATAVWRVRPSGNNNNGGGYDPGIAGAATDYSQQNAAQATGTNATCATGTSTFIDATANAFTSAMIGNAIFIRSGTNFTAGFYFVTAFTSASTVTLDRTPVGGTNGSAGVWSLGGGFADLWTNISPDNSTPAPVAGNTIYVLGSGTPNPSSYTVDYLCSTGNTSLRPALGNSTAGYVTYANDPQTPGYKAPPDTTGGMPVIKSSTAGPNMFGQSAWDKFQGLWFVLGSGGTGTPAVFHGNNVFNYILFGCVLDQNAFDAGLALTGNGTTAIIGCEVFTSVAPGANGTNYAISNTVGYATFIGCNIHDTVGPGVNATSGASTVSNNIIAKCRGLGLITDDHSYGSQLSTSVIFNNTIDGNIGNGIEVVGTTVSITGCVIFNNIISNHTTAATFGLTIDTGTTATNDKLKAFIDYNVFYNNLTDVNVVSYGSHDTHGGANPYVGQATENYTLA